MIIHNNKGQIMLLTTLVLSATLLAAVMVAGVLMVYQIRQAGNAGQSAKAIFAADTGIEFELFKFYKDKCASSSTLSNGAIVESDVTTDSASRTIFTARGQAGNTFRGLSLNLGAIDSPAPDCP